MPFSSQLHYAEFNLQVQVKLEVVMTSVRTQECYRETVGAGKNTSFEITEKVYGWKKLKTIWSSGYSITDNGIVHSNIAVFVILHPAAIIYLNRKNKNVWGSIHFIVEQWPFQGLSSSARMCGNLSSSLIHSVLFSSASLSKSKTLHKCQDIVLWMLHNLIFTVSWTRNQKVKP